MSSERNIFHFNYFKKLGLSGLSGLSVLSGFSGISGFFEYFFQSGVLLAQGR